MKIGIDFDGTISADPLAFKAVVIGFLDQGHDVAIVTWREPPEVTLVTKGYGDSDIQEVFAMWGFKRPVIYTSGKAKRDFYPADIWIEDNPAAILFSLTRPPRFEADPSNYGKDVLVCQTTGFPDVVAEWPQLRALGEKYHA